MKDSDRDWISSHPVFNSLPASDLVVLLQGVIVQDLPADAVLFSQGESPDFLHVLIDGRVGLIGEGADGKQVVVEFMEPGESFILAAALTNAPYLMTARTLHRSRVMLIPAKQLRERVSTDAALASKMLASLARHYRMLVRQIKDLKLRSATERLGCYLLALAEQRPAGPDASVTLMLPVEKALLATRLGTTPENLSRAFANLRSAGVRTSGATVTIADLARLRTASFSDPAIPD
ncbi:cyclic nucleotide-binding domain-containing protein [Skermanella rosea]|uniref:cyclic nucleotide-binding domain-containing protein n=1 Tax=Skermanella rosea TaxID=1817965 RepID=UPI001934B06E|nr:cyclic nucleotide-binding domain-containing protein [Skermanella rosea]UEM05786.1 cyclic nucleotide-binding domain-containing protein [Skermanella rosea]